MSDIRKAINSLISQKIQNCNEALAQAGTDLEKQGLCLGDYRLWFDGAAELARAAGLDPSDIRSLIAAQQANEAELLLVERKAALQEALGQDQD